MEKRTETGWVTTLCGVVGIFATLALGVAEQALTGGYFVEQYAAILLTAFAGMMGGGLVYRSRVKKGQEARKAEAEARKNAEMTVEGTIEADTRNGGFYGTE